MDSTTLENQTYPQMMAENIITVLNITPTPDQAKNLVEILERFGESYAPNTSKSELE